MARQHPLPDHWAFPVPKGREMIERTENKGQKTVLLIDDNHDTLDMLEMFLYDEFEILTALNGFEGLTMAKEHLPDCILADIMMPVMDGIKLFNCLKKDKATASIPIVAVTSFSRRITSKSLLNMGFNGVVSKPLERQVVLDTVYTMLAKR
ncbi:MAG: response regulator [Chitinivibrionales bacterium]|nr:response regulator [Chitinivibrionales bacterium]MBD3357430.1 response regulator [Chitinivibrionales bacterium]